MYTLSRYETSPGGAYSFEIQVFEGLDLMEFNRLSWFISRRPFLRKPESLKCRHDTQDSTGLDLIRSKSDGD